MGMNLRKVVMWEGSGEKSVRKDWRKVLEKTSEDKSQQWFLF
jgi:hypothetical protein